MASSARDWVNEYSEWASLHDIIERQIELQMLFFPLFYQIIASNWPEPPRECENKRDTPPNEPQSTADDKQKLDNRLKLWCQYDAKAVQMYFRVLIFVMCWQWNVVKHEMLWQIQKLLPPLSWCGNRDAGARLPVDNCTQFVVLEMKSSKTNNAKWDETDFWLISTFELPHKLTNCRSLVHHTFGANTCMRRTFDEKFKALHS